MVCWSDSGSRKPMFALLSFDQRRWGRAFQAIHTAPTSDCSLVPENGLNDTRRRAEAVCKSRTDAWLRTELGNAPQLMKSPRNPGMAVEAGQTRLMSPTLPATLVQMGLFM